MLYSLNSSTGYLWICLWMPDSLSGYLWLLIGCLLVVIVLWGIIGLLFLGYRMYISQLPTATHRPPPFPFQYGTQCIMLHHSNRYGTLCIIRYALCSVRHTAMCLVPYDTMYNISANDDLRYMPIVHHVRLSLTQCSIVTMVVMHYVNILTHGMVGGGVMMHCTICPFINASH